MPHRRLAPERHQLCRRASFGARRNTNFVRKRPGGPRVSRQIRRVLRGERLARQAAPDRRRALRHQKSVGASRTECPVAPLLLQIAEQRLQHTLGRSARLEGPLLPVPRTVIQHVRQFPPIFRHFEVDHAAVSPVGRPGDLATAHQHADRLGQVVPLASPRSSPAAPGVLLYRLQRRRYVRTSASTGARPARSALRRCGLARRSISVHTRI